MSGEYESWSPEELQAARNARRRVEGRRAKWGYGLLTAGWTAVIVASVALVALDAPANTAVAAAVAACALGSVAIGIGCWMVLGSVDRRWGAFGILGIVLAWPIAGLLAFNMLDGRTERESCTIASVAVETRDTYYHHHHYQVACPTGTYKVVESPTGRAAEPRNRYATGERVRVRYDRAADARGIDTSKPVPGKLLFSAGLAVLAILTAATLYLRRGHTRTA